MRHPAPYADKLLPLLGALLAGCDAVLDPFAGTGKLRKVCPQATLVEIEPEWAVMGGALVGDALALPFEDDLFDAICTSPTYGNRMADQYVDEGVRHTYRYALGRPLDAGSSGRLQWGEVLELERALVGQAGERPAGGGLGQAQRGDEGHLGHERGLAPVAHDLAGPIQDQARVRVKEVGVEVGHA